MILLAESLLGSGVPGGGKHNGSLIAVCVFASLGLGSAYNYSVRPRYEAVARIELNRVGPGATDPGESQARATPRWLEAQYTAFVDPSLLALVVSEFELADTAELSNGPMRSPRELLQARLTGEGPLRVAASAASAVTAFRSRVVVRPIVGTRFVDLVFLAYDPSFAMIAVNGLARRLAEKSNAGRPVQTAGAADRSAARLEQGKLASVESGSMKLRIREARARLREGRDSIAIKKARVDQLRQRSPAALLTLAEQYAGEGFEARRAELEKVELRRADLEQSLGPRHPDMVAMAGRIQSLRATLLDEANAVVATAEAEYAAAVNDQHSLETALRATEAELSTLKAPGGDRLLPPSDASKGLSSVVEATATDREVRLVHAADLPTTPVFPDRTGNLRAALAVGMISGLLLVALRKLLGGDGRDTGEPAGSTREAESDQNISRPLA